jgi:iron(III) transport system ATP-binding protein
MAKNPVAVTLDRVTRIYKNVKGRPDVVAVRDSSFEVAPGELVTLLGPSGCGKTTTLRMIAGFDLPSSGSIRIGGEDVACCRRTSGTPPRYSRATACSPT